MMTYAMTKRLMQVKMLLKRVDSFTPIASRAVIKESHITHFTLTLHNSLKYILRVCLRVWTCMCVLKVGIKSMKYVHSRYGMFYYKK